MNKQSENSVKKPQSITISAPARLHMGFIDMSGALGRHFGSIGVGLNEMATRIHLSAAEQLSIEGPCAERAQACVLNLCHKLGVSDAVKLQIETAIPDHVGLGSGTQLALAIGVAVSEYYALDLTVRDVAALTDRGARSGIGIAVFEQGGLVVDGGRGGQTQTPPLLSRIHFPADWRFILVYDQRGQGLHGQQELDAFKSLAPFPRARAEQLAYLLLMQALPALAEHDLSGFGEVITALQNAVGEHFAPVQGGVFTSLAVAEAMLWLESQGAVAVGQTSWGPTGFCLVSDQDKAEALLVGLTQKNLPHLSYQIASARNIGAEIVKR